MNIHVYGERRKLPEEMEDAALKMISLRPGLVMDSADLFESWQRAVVT